MSTPHPSPPAGPRDDAGHAPGRGLPRLARQVLETLRDTGPIPVEDIPCRWPLTRMHLKYVVDELLDAGVAEWVDPADAETRRLGLSGNGRRVLDGDPKIIRLR